MTPHYTQKRRKDGSLNRIYYYRCTKTMHFDNSECKIKSVNAAQMENTIIEYISGLTRNPVYLNKSIDQLNRELKKEIGPIKAEIGACGKRLNEIDREIENLVEGVAKGKNSVEILEKAISKHKEEKADLENRQFELEQRIRGSEFEQYDLELVRANLSDFRRIFEALEEKEKPRCLELILRDIIMFKEKIVINIFDLPEFNIGSQIRSTKLPGPDSNQSRHERDG